ncbi:MAG: hypothetical protein RL685_1690 [Pseudomonadota bacterium]|jgi:2-polyprenyl-3-methyl-5-hydroxy-6-metoxy-1,4-benzoquinol methylase
MTLIRVPCPVCDGADFAALYPATIVDEEDAPERYFSSSRERAGYLPIVRCTGCGLVLQNPRDDAETLVRVYASLADSVYEAEDDSRARSAREHLDLVEAHRPERGRLLDLGCASGLFVAEAVRRGWRARGADASPWAIEQARKHCPSAPFDVGALEELRVEPGSFDVITLFDVLEHVHDPRAVLSIVRGWLAPGGLLVLSVPNAGSWVARWLGPRWVLLLREHLWYFAPPTLARLLQRTGLELVDSRMKWVSFSLNNVAARLAQYPGWLGRAGRSASDLHTLKKVIVRFPMGEMDVVARLSPKVAPVIEAE